MMQGKIKIGDFVAKPGWTQCGFYVADVGEIYLFGRIFDYRERKWVSNVMVEPISEKWSRVKFLIPALVLSTVN